MRTRGVFRAKGPGFAEEYRAEVAQHARFFLGARRKVVSGQRRRVHRLFLLSGGGLLLILKALYAMASLEQLRFLLAPVSAILGSLHHAPYVFVPDAGYRFPSLHMVIDASCAGGNFMLLCVAVTGLACYQDFKPKHYRWWVIPTLLLIGWLLAIVANVARINLILVTREFSTQFFWIKSVRFHEAQGIVVYLITLMAAFLFTRFLIRRKTVLSIQGTHLHNVILSTKNQNMKILLHPRWLLATNVGPAIILLCILYDSFHTIQLLLPEDSRTIWTWYLYSLIVLSGLQLLMATTLMIRKKNVSVVYSIVSLGVHITLLINYYLDFRVMVPWHIPAWMLPESLLHFAGTFLMPAMAHALAVIVVRLTSETTNPLLNALGAVAIPVFMYVYMQVVFPLWQPVNDRYAEHALLVLLAVVTVFFLFFVTRLVYALVIRNWKRAIGFGGAIALRALVGVGLPLAGLTVNQKIDNLFGDFDTPVFFLLAALNGIFIALPAVNKYVLRLGQFIGRSILYAYTFYFFIVFLPWLPLAPVGIIAFGGGFLMLTPLAVMILHSHQLHQDFTFLRDRFKPVALTTIMLVGMSVIPSSLIYSYYADRHTLHDALAGIYEPDLSADPKPAPNRSALQRVLATITAQKRNGFSGMHHNTPFLSSLYSSIVLDNLTLSDKKIERIQDVYGLRNNRPIIPSPPLDRPAISAPPYLMAFSAKSTYNKHDKVWISDVELSLKNPGRDMNEFVTTFNAPEGCWFSDYYLTMEGRKEKGILVEKKSATWIYQQITSENRDPGLLSYIDSNTIMLRVFPFAAGEIRTTGFQVLHKESATLFIDGHAIHLGDDRQNLRGPILSPDHAVGYFPAMFKKTLPTHTRKPYYHFIIDCSASAKKETLIKRLRLFSAPEQGMGPTRYTLSNFSAVTLDDRMIIEHALAETSFEGGFFLERAIQKILFAAHKNIMEYPKIVVVTDRFDKAILPSGFSDMAAAIPELDYFYSLSATGSLLAHSFKDPGTTVPADEAVTRRVVAWPATPNPQFLLRDDGQPSIQIQRQPSQSDSNIEDVWMAGLSLRGKWIAHHFYPQYTSQDWLTIVKGSFAIQVLTPMTAFIALENEAQKAVLRKKQEDVLKAKHFLDIGEETRMSEPGLLTLFTIILLFATYYDRTRLKVWLKN